ncbi:uncharacterized protein [Polyergus mexicanus]|uniref:uncharacterized protein isoform X2 n=1 Tax=Polyergus mexicanus TaxID=615972 RepID=UPI0038B4C5B6
MWMEHFLLFHDFHMLHTNVYYTIHIRYMETNIAAVYVLCEKRTKSMYNAIWKNIKELAPDFQKNLHFIMSDYEAAAISSMNENFPQSKIHGCWFHFNQQRKLALLVVL